MCEQVTSQSLDLHTDLVVTNGAVFAVLPDVCKSVPAILPALAVPSGNLQEWSSMSLNLGNCPETS